MAKRKSLVRLGRGAFLSTAVIPESFRSWEVRAAVTRARALVATTTPEGETRALLTGEAAVAAYGLSTWHSTPDLHVWPLKEQGSVAAVSLPHVTARGIIVPKARLSRQRAVKFVGETLAQLDGAEYTRDSFGYPRRVRPPAQLPVVGLAEAALDCARFEHPLVAWIAMCGALRRLSWFDAFKQEAWQRREAQVKHVLAETVVPLRKRRGSKRLASIIAGASGGVDGPGEGAIHWLVSILLRGDRRDVARFQAQCPFWEEGGRRHFVDLGFPHLRFGFEFDGVGKVMDHSQAKSWVERERALRESGWSLARYTMDEVSDMEGLMESLGQELSAVGLRVQPPGGPAWKPVDQRLLAPARRF